MKKTLLVIVLSLFYVGIKAQQAVGTPEELKRFFNTTTYVVLEKNPMLQYNHIIKETVEKHWDLTPYEFVTFSTEEFEEARMDSTKSFLIVNTLYFDRDKTKAKYDYLCVELGGDYEFVRQMPDIANVPIAYHETEEENYAYKLGMLCRFLQNHIELTKENPDLTEKKIIKYYYKNLTADIHDKVLYLTKDDLAKEFQSEKAIKEIYPYEFKIVTKEDIKKAIDEKDENVVFVHKVGPEGKRKARCYKTIVGAGDAQLYYFSYHMINDKKPDGLLKKDLKKLAKAK